MIILPVRSEKDTSRYPKVTVALITINLIIWVFTNHITTREMKRIEGAHNTLLALEMEYIPTLMRENPELLQQGDIQAFHQAFLDQRIIPTDAPIYESWLEALHKFKHLSTTTLFHRWGFIPARMNLFKLIISIFLHGNFFHVFGNMLYLWIVGCNIEDEWGWKRFLGLYFLSGAAAVAIHTAYSPTMTTPIIGASGAVAGVMGAFMIQYFKTKIRFVYFFWLIIRPYWGIFRIRAGLVLPFWFLQEFFMARSGVQTGVAHWAHVGGFAFGMIASAVLSYMRPSPEELMSPLERARASWSELPENIFENPHALPELQQILEDEPNHIPARVALAQMAIRNGHRQDAAVFYGLALDQSIELADRPTAMRIYREIKENKLFRDISAGSLYNIGQLLEGSEMYHNAVKVYAAYSQWHLKGTMRPKALYRAYRLLKTQIHNDTLARKALMRLKKEYPDFSVQAG